MWRNFELKATTIAPPLVELRLSTTAKDGSLWADHEELGDQEARTGGSTETVGSGG